MKTRNIRLKKRWLVLAVVVLVVSVTALLCHIRVLSGIKFTRDQETGELWTDTSDTIVQEFVSLRLEKDRVSIWDGEVRFHLEYTGNEVLEYSWPTLEMRRNGTWTYVQRKPVNVNLVQYFIQNGDKKPGALRFDQFGRFLPPGDYRLAVWLGGEKSAVEFEVGWW